MKRFQTIHMGQPQNKRNFTENAIAKISEISRKQLIKPKKAQKRASRQEKTNHNKTTRTLKIYHQT